MDEKVSERALVPAQPDLQVALRGAVSLWASATTSESERRRITATQNALDHQSRSTTRVYVQRIAVKRDLYSDEISKRWSV
jgi:hypothetical protein